MSKLKKALYIILIIAVLTSIVYLGITWLSYEGVIEKEKFWEYFKNWGIPIILGTLGAIFITYLVINKIIERKKDGKDGAEIPKVYVNTHEAIIDTFCPAFIINTKMPYYIDYSQKKEGIVKSNDLTIKNTKKFDEAVSGVPHVEFEAWAKSGIYKGINFCIIRLDEGLEKVKLNWNSYIQNNMNADMHKYNRKYTPLTTVQNENLRAKVHMHQQISEGENKEDLEKIYSDLKLKERPVASLDLSEEELEKIRKKKDLEEAIQKPK